VYKIAQRTKIDCPKLLRGPMSLRRTISRNREILAKFKAGQSIESLSEEHGLSVERVRAVLVDEKNRHIYSPEPFYRALRSGSRR